MFEQTTNERSHRSEPVRAWALCTNRACGAEREVAAVRNSIGQRGVDGGFKLMNVIETHHLEVADVEYTCPQCEGPCVISAQPRREVQTFGYPAPPAPVQ